MDSNEIFIKAVSEDEIIMHQKVQIFLPDLSPKIYDIRVLENKKYEITMEKLRGKTIAEYFGDKNENTPEHIWEQIRSIISTLLDKGIEYVDITPYNFIYDYILDIVKIIDFGSNGVYFKTERTIENWYIEELLNGLSEWNPDFN
jgi:serine/threonine protein kinase